MEDKDRIGSQVQVGTESATKGCMPITMTVCAHCGQSFLQTKTLSTYCCEGCRLASRLSELIQAGPSSNEFEHLDSEEFRSLYTSAEKPLRMSFFVEGLHCSACIHTIENIPEYRSEVQSIIVDYSVSTIDIQLKDKNASFGSVARLIHDLGYRLKALKPDETPQELLKKEFRQWIQRIGISGALASNIMMFAISNYLGADPSFRKFFDGLSFVLFIPVILYGMWPFYLGFYRGLKSNQITIDGTIVLAAWTGFLLSTWNYFSGVGSVYYDSLASFLFLILLTRFFVWRLQVKFSLQSSDFNVIGKDYALLADSLTKVPLSSLKKGDRIRLEVGDSVPVDGALVSESAEVDSSLMTGESRSVLLAQGNLLRAGERILSPFAIVEVRAVGTQTWLGGMLEDIRKKAMAGTSALTKTDSYARILTVVVFGLAALVMLGPWGLGPTEKMERALALLIVACPCALAFGAPLAYAIQLKRALDRGVLIKSADVLNRINEVDTVVFDKTGTLALPNPVVTGWNWVNPPTSTDWDILYSLEAPSQHPVANAIKKHLRDKHCSLLVLQNWSENRGVSAEWSGSVYRILPHGDIYKFYKGEELLASIQILTSLEETSRKVVQFLTQRKMEVWMLSGDSFENSHRVAEVLGIPSHRVLYSQTPDSKSQFIRGLQANNKRVLMAGDGANDSLALTDAYVGVAVRGAMDVSLQSSSVYLLRQGVSQIPELFNLGKYTMTTLTRNYLIAIIYNAISGSAAILGLVGPLSAALLMPVASGILILNTYRSGRLKT